MIRLPDRELPPRAQSKLAEYQREVDAIADYEQRVYRGKTSFGSHNRRGNATFDAVKETLTEMCAGARRCAYCEDSAADEVEHIRPKDLYPEAVFVWLNYVYACGPCNGPKNNRFAVFHSITGALTEVSRPRGAKVVPPISGAPLLIDPRTTDPLAFMELDLRDTFWFVPRAAPGTSEHQRALYTIRVLGLNTRDFLPKARQQAFKDYKAHLSQYRSKVEQGAPARHLRRLEEDLRARQHPTVWSEMKRQHASIPALAALFRAVPQALSW